MHSRRHVVLLETGVNAYVSHNLKSGDIYCIVTNEMKWESSGMQHVVSRESISDVASEVAKTKGCELDAALQAKVDRIDDVHVRTESPRVLR